MGNTEKEGGRWRHRTKERGREEEVKEYVEGMEEETEQDVREN